MYLCLYDKVVWPFQQMVLFYTTVFSGSNTANFLGSKAARTSADLQLVSVPLIKITHPLCFILSKKGLVLCGRVGKSKKTDFIPSFSDARLQQVFFFFFCLPRFRKQITSARQVRHARVLCSTVVRMETVFILPSILLSLNSSSSLFIWPLLSQQH